MRGLPKAPPLKIWTNRTPRSTSRRAPAGIHASTATRTDSRHRDQYRHPVEALTFWGLKPRMTVLEIQPGAGWWTNILAPYAQRTGGKLYVTGAAVADGKLFAISAAHGVLLTIDPVARTVVAAHRIE